MVQTRLLIKWLKDEIDFGIMLEYLANILKLNEFLALVFEPKVFKKDHGRIFHDEGPKLCEMIL